MRLGFERSSCCGKLSLDGLCHVCVLISFIHIKKLQEF